jgi:restriction system protein
MSNAWMVRAGQGGYIVEDFIKESVVAIGWSALSDLSAINNRDELKNMVDSAYQEDRPGKRRSNLTQVATFLFDIQPGDTIVSYNPNLREYHIGTIQNKYEYADGLIHDYPHIHRVTWSSKVGRDVLSLRTRNTLGAIQTVFSLNDVIDELNSPAQEKPSTNTDVEGLQSEMEQLRQDVISRSHEFIKDRVQSLSWEDMQDLVSGLLRAMGYQTRVSPPGADRGKDIVASPDGLGLKQPRIRVEVKHRPKETIGAPTIRIFLGALRQGDCGVYVATGGYTKEAHYEAERAQFPVTLVDLDDLVTLLTQHYEKLDMESRAMIPLVQVYWPAN